MKIVQEDVDKLHQAASSSEDRLLSDVTSNENPGKEHVSEETEELSRYQVALSYLSQSARMPENTATSETQVAKIPKIPFAESIKAEYHEKVSNESNFLVPECPRLRILVMGKLEAGKSTLCARLLGLSDEAVSCKRPIWSSNELYRSLTLIRLGLVIGEKEPLSTKCGNHSLGHKTHI